MKIKTRKRLELFLSLPKTLYFNIKMFGLKDGLKLPVFVSHNTILYSLEKGSIKFGIPLKRGIVKFGFSGSINPPGNRCGSITILKNADITFNSSAVFSPGCSLRVDGKLTFFGKFTCNSFSFISCSHIMSFGNDVNLGWNVTVRDSDGHTVIGNDGMKKPCSKPVIIGNHVWICSHASILRCKVGNNCIVAWGSIVTHNFLEEGSLIAGIPAKIIQSGISWIK